MKVRITCGAYGHRPDMNEPRIVRKDNTSPPFEVEDTEAKRIIALGIAENCEEDGDRSLSYDISICCQNTKEENCMIVAETVMSMGYNDMKKMAKELGVDAKGTKEELQERLIIALDGIKDTEKNQQDIEKTENNDNGEAQSASDDSEQNLDQDTESDEKPPLLEAQVPV